MVYIYNTHTYMIDYFVAIRIMQCILQVYTIMLAKTGSLPKTRYEIVNTEYQKPLCKNKVDIF